MHWKNCPTAWQGSYTGRKVRPTIILEAVASYDTWIWHSFIGVPGALNDLNVLYKSDIIDPLLAGISPRVTYKVNGSTYDHSYYLADGIYPRYSSFVKTIPNPQTDAEKLFAKKQESYRKMLKDVSEFYNPVGQYFVMRIIEEEFVEEEFVEHEEEDLHNPSIAFAIYDGPVGPSGIRIQHDLVDRAKRSEAFHNRLNTLQSAYLHTQLQSDLVKHNWVMETGEEL
ncbi:hypothetical protein QQ045_017776 [Rhodiola kirilowii]